MHIMAAYLMKTSLALLLCASLGDGIPLSSFYSYGSAAGDSTLGAIDDGSSPAIASSTAFVFYGNSYSTIYVSSNGIITLGGCFYYYMPNAGAPFPINTNSLTNSAHCTCLDGTCTCGATIVAPFFADVDNSVGNGRVWYRLTSNATLLSQAKNDIPVALSGPNFNPRQLLIATWDHVGYYKQHTDKTNTFQCILATDSVNSYAILKYADGLIQWTSGDNQSPRGNEEAQVGFNSGDGVNNASVPGSLTTAIINISSTSNVGVPGQWVAMISSSPITISDVNQCAPNGGQGPCGQICTNKGGGSFSCSCQTGYMLSGYSCVDINECIPNGGLGPCQQNCTNTIGSFICSCQSGYTSSGYNCTDIDECSMNGGQGPCPQVCTNTPGAYNCSCYPCQNGLCINTSCWCVATYTGGNCSQPVFSGCELNPCLNGGVCIMSGQNSTCVCPANTTGLYCENSMRGCTISDAATTLILNTIIRRRYLGISPDVPAASCAEIKSVRSEVTTGVYWTLNAVGMPALVFCQYL